MNQIIKVSNTIVKNGMPFIEPVLRNVEPFVDKMLVTVSAESNDGTKELLDNLEREWKGKLEVSLEFTRKPYQLTEERQKQLDKTEMGAWVLFLDADDYWPAEQLKLVDLYLGGDIDGLAVNPFQVIDGKYHDDNWRVKWFTKWFKNQPGVHYERPWPRDLIFRDHQMLYWKNNDRVPRVPIKFFHLSNLMKWRFRDEAWAKEFRSNIGSKKLYERGWEDDLNEIYKYIK